MADNVQGDQFVMIKIEGMHCHRCQQAIQKALQAYPGVHEAEVDFASGQASVLFDPESVKIKQLLDAVTQAGYRPTGFTPGRAAHDPEPPINPAEPNLAWLQRPPETRRREHRYALAQCIVFGLPVIVLHLAGQHLGGPEAPRWSGLLQLLLTGWIIYLAATPALVEGLARLLSARLSAGLIIGAAALSLFLLSTAGWVYALFNAEPSPMPGFPWPVVLLIVWHAIQWLHWRAR